MSDTDTIQLLDDLDKAVWPEWVPFGSAWSPLTHLLTVSAAVVVLFFLTVVSVVVLNERRRRHKAAEKPANRETRLPDRDMEAAASIGQAIALDEFRQDRMNLIFQVWNDQPNTDDMEEVIQQTADSLRERWRDREWSVPRTEKFCDRYEYVLTTLLDDYRLTALLLSARLTGTTDGGTRTYPSLVEISETGSGLCAVFTGCTSVTLESWEEALPYLTTALDAPKATVRPGDDGEVVLHLNDRAIRPTTGPRRKALHHAQLERNRIPATKRATAPAPIPSQPPDTAQEDGPDTALLPLDVDVVDYPSSPILQIEPAAAAPPEKPARRRHGLPRREGRHQVGGT